MIDLDTPTEVDLCDELSPETDRAGDVHPNW